MLLRFSYHLILALVWPLAIFASLPAHAQSEHQLIRRLVVFPMKSDREAGPALDEAWWQAREEFTKSRRFLVASKQFLVRSDVFEPRGDLEPADAIILGKLLDSHALVTLRLEDHEVTMVVYDGGNGITLFSKTVPLHPSLAVSDQLSSIARRLADDFIATIPYQGFTTVDSLIGHPVYEEGDVKLARVDLGIGTGAQIGDVVEWVKIVSTNAAPLFQGGSKTTIFAEGKIMQINEGVATVEILRATSLREISEFSLVRVPRVADRQAAELSAADKAKATLTADLVSPEANPMKQVARERRPLVATLSFVGSIAVFLLLAF